MISFPIPSILSIVCMLLYIMFQMTSLTKSGKVVEFIMRFVMVNVRNG